MYGGTNRWTDRQRQDKTGILVTGKLAIKLYNVPQPAQGGALEHCRQLCRGEDAQVQWTYASDPV